MIKTEGMTIGQGYVHVHHVVPIADMGELYTVDPITDLRPVCTNCHGIIHRQKPPLTIDEMQALVDGTK